MLRLVCVRFQLVPLDDEDMKELNEFHKKPGMHRGLIGYHQKGRVWGWTYEQLGWDMEGDGIVKE